MRPLRALTYPARRSSSSSPRTGCVPRRADAKTLTFSPQFPVAFQSEAEIHDACGRRIAGLHAERLEKTIQSPGNQKSADPGLNFQQSSAVQTAPAAWNSENNLARDKALAGPESHPKTLRYFFPNVKCQTERRSTPWSQRVRSDCSRAPPACEIANRHIHHTTHDKHWNQTTQLSPPPRKSRLGHSSDALCGFVPCSNCTIFNSNSASMIYHHP